MKRTLVYAALALVLFQAAPASADPGAAQANGVVLAAPAAPPTEGPMPQTREHVLLARTGAQGDVDGRDFLMWQRGGSPATERGTVGSLEADGSVSPSDYNVWRANFGASPATVGGGR